MSTADAASPARTRSPARTPGTARRARPSRGQAAAPSPAARRGRASRARPCRPRSGLRRSVRPRRAGSRDASSRIWRSVSSSGSRSCCDTNRSPRTSRSGSSRKLWGETVRSTPASRSSAPRCGSSSSPVDSLFAIALIVKSRRRRSCSSEISGEATISKSWRPGPVDRSVRGGANSIPPRASARSSPSRGCSLRPTRLPATSRSSTRPCGASAARSSS